MKTYIWRHQIFPTLLLFLCIIFCIYDSETIRMEMQKTLYRCFNVIIPSLYAMMILSQILIHSDIWRILARPFRRITSAVFGLPDSCFALFLLSQVAGYPVGASMIHTLYQNGTLKKQDASRFLCVCYGSGPAFLLGLMGTQKYASTLALLTFSSCFLSNLLLTVFFFRKNPITLSDTQQKLQNHPVSSSIVIQSTAEAGKTLLRLCGIILCFSAFCAILDSFGVFRFLEFGTEQLSFSLPITEIVRSVLEITNAVNLTLPSTIQFPLLAGLLSFGGFCVIFQISSIAGELFSIRRFFLTRITVSLLSASFCHLGIRLFLPESNVISTAYAPLTPVRIGFHAVVPSCLLICMTLLVIREDQNREKF